MKLKVDERDEDQTVINFLTCSPAMSSGKIVDRNVNTCCENEFFSAGNLIKRR